MPSSWRKPKKRRSAAALRATVARFSGIQASASRLQRLRRGAGEAAAEQLGSAAQVALIGEQGVARGAGFGRHHFEEGRDQLPILAVAGHSRAIGLGGDHPRFIFDARPRAERGRSGRDRRAGRRASCAVCMPTPASRATAPGARSRAACVDRRGPAVVGAEAEAGARGLVGVDPAEPGERGGEQLRALAAGAVVGRDEGVEPVARRPAAARRPRAAPRRGRPAPPARRRAPSAPPRGPCRRSASRR